MQNVSGHEDMRRNVGERIRPIHPRHRHKKRNGTRIFGHLRIHKDAHRSFGFAVRFFDADLSARKRTERIVVHLRKSRPHDKKRHKKRDTVEYGGRRHLLQREGAFNKIEDDRKTQKARRQNQNARRKREHRKQKEHLYRKRDFPARLRLRNPYIDVRHDRIPHIAIHLRRASCRSFGKIIILLSGKSCAA